MPMYFPDLKSVQRIAKMMMEHRGNKKYTGIYPNRKICDVGKGGTSHENVESLV